MDEEKPIVSRNKALEKSKVAIMVRNNIPVGFPIYRPIITMVYQRRSNMTMPIVSVVEPELDPRI